MTLHMPLPLYRFANILPLHGESFPPCVPLQLQLKATQVAPRKLFVKTHGTESYPELSGMKCKQMIDFFFVYVFPVTQLPLLVQGIAMEPSFEIMSSLCSCIYIANAES